MQKIINKIKEYYKPEISGVNLILTINNNKKYLYINDHKKIILTFGVSAKTEEEAIKVGGFKTTSNELFKLLYPKEWDEVKDRYEPDKRTKKYLDSVKNNIGYIKTEADYNEIKINVVDKHFIWIGVTGDGYVSVGQDDNNNWIAQYSIRTAIDDYTIVKHYFNKKPSVKDILMTERLKDINWYFNYNGWDKNTFICWECGIRHHWLDCPGDLMEKWENFKERYCGC